MIIFLYFLLFREKWRCLNLFSGGATSHDKTCAPVLQLLKFEQLLKKLFIIKLWINVFFFFSSHFLLFLFIFCIAASLQPDDLNINSRWHQVLMMYRLRLNPTTICESVFAMNNCFTWEERRKKLPTQYIEICRMEKTLPAFSAFKCSHADTKTRNWLAV